MNIPKLRTISAAFKEIKDADPNTSITEYSIRYLVVTGRVPSIKRGTKYLLNPNDLAAYYEAERTNSIEAYFAMLKENGGRG